MLKQEVLWLCTVQFQIYLLPRQRAGKQIMCHFYFLLACHLSDTHFTEINSDPKVLEMSVCKRKHLPFILALLLVRSNNRPPFLLWGREREMRPRERWGRMSVPAVHCFLLHTRRFVHELITLCLCVIVQTETHLVCSVVPFWNGNVSWGGKPYTFRFADRIARLQAFVAWTTCALDLVLIAEVKQCVTYSPVYFNVVCLCTIYCRKVHVSVCGSEFIHIIFHCS